MPRNCKSLFSIKIKKKLVPFAGLLHSWKSSFISSRLSERMNSNFEVCATTLNGLVKCRYAKKHCKRQVKRLIANRELKKLRIKNFRPIPWMSHDTLCPVRKTTTMIYFMKSGKLYVDSKRGKHLTYFSPVNQLFTV